MIGPSDRLRTHFTGNHSWVPSLKLTLRSDTSILHDSSGYRYPVKMGIPPLDFPCRKHPFGALNISFAPFSRSLLYTFRLGQNFEHLTLSGDYLDYRHAINKPIVLLDSPQWEHSFELLNVLFALFSRSLLYKFTLGQNFEHLTMSGDYLGYRHAINGRIAPLDFPHREYPFELLNAPFALFSRSFLHTFTLRLNFEYLTILQVTLGYRHAIAKRIPPLDSPHWEHPFGLLDILFPLFSRSFLYTFTLGRNFEPLTILQVTLDYWYAIAKRIPPLDFPHRQCSSGLPNVPLAPFSRSLLHTFTLGQTFEHLTILQVTLGYRYAIAKGILPLDFPHWEHSSGLLNVLFAPFSRSLLHTFRLEPNFQHLNISGDYLGYRHAITKRILPLDSPHQEHSLEPVNVLFAPFLGFSFSLSCVQ